MLKARSGVTDVSWPAICEPVGASMLALQFQLQQSEYWSSEQLLEQQLAQLQLLLTHAVEQSPWYRQQAEFRLLANQNYPLSLQQFADLPRLTRSALQQNLKAITATSMPPAHGQRLELATSGSTGTPLLGWESELNHFFWGGCNLRDQLWHQRDLTQTFAAIRTNVEHQVLPDWGSAISASFETGPAITLNISTPVEQQLDWLMEHQPGYLLSHASNLQALAQLSLRKGLRLNRLRAAISFGERLPDPLRELCAAAWQVPLQDIYSAEEVGYIALQCPQDESNYHVMSEQLLVEVLNANGDPCKAGQSGKVVITSLHNFAMPLIRYEIGDFARVGAACRCGRGLPVFTEILGRARNMITLPNGHQHWPSFPADLWLSVAPIEQFQLEQTSRGQIIGHYVMAEPLNADQQQLLTDKLAQSLKFEANIVLEHHHKPLNKPGEKFEDFISRL
ncbi:MAG: phenylacetate--CoA ligase family protein [Immundisolibacteraceae bacterium]|nr:phenylacetate--CoA ligase family protein [Immundisolibacteraceae bacterium]